MRHLFRVSLNLRRALCTHKLPHEEAGKVSTILKGLSAKIKISGPISVAEYMREVLTSPLSGYYMNRDVFGAKGDFITSPEISQIFGELIGVWAVSEWQRLNCPKPLHLVELGPGRGTMMEDILRVYKTFDLEKDMSVHLVEISPQLSDIQSRRLCVSFEDVDDKDFYKKGVTQEGVPVFWYRSIIDLPAGFSCILAHEFFDALPIHKFQRTKEGWREVLIDVGPNGSGKLRFVVAPSHTPASALLTKRKDRREACEVSPESGVLMTRLGARLEEHGGFLLVADYGHSGEKGDTFRAFKNHKLHDPLEDPGSADLTADVDFSYLEATSKEQLVTVGPITQREFLHNMFIMKRIEALSSKCKDEEEKAALRSCYHMLTDKDKMGERFKFMAFYPLVLKEYLETFPVTGFSKSSH